MQARVDDHLQNQTLSRKANNTAYCGRFAPTPSGPLHFGSLINAVASYCQARAANGLWKVRIENLDPPREVAGAAEQILTTLEKFNMHWDGDVLLQSTRAEAYASALQQLVAQGDAYACACSRKMVAAAGKMGIEGPIYPQTCRSGLHGKPARSWRAVAPEQPISYLDAVFGEQTQNVATTIGDFVIKRADGYFAYQLAVVVDDAFQGITEIVRGVDIQASTARQIALQQMLKLSTPTYFHHPVALQSNGDKLSKSRLAPDINRADAAQALYAALAFLQQSPPPMYNTSELLDWAVENWTATNITMQNRMVNLD